MRTMEPLVIQLPLQRDQHALNRRRWEELCADPELAKLPNRIETNRHGHIIMMPPPAGIHGSRQGEIAYLLRSKMPPGTSVTECPISTSNGVKAADVGWYSKARIAPIADEICFSIAPEICVEVLSPSNTSKEIDEKKLLYFDAGAEEVWICDADGAMSYFLVAEPGAASDKSILCPDFPGRIEFP